MVCYSRPTHTLRPAYQIWSRFILSPTGGEKPHFMPFFGLRHLVVSPIGNSLRKLNTSAQLQTFHCPTVSKSFLYSNAFIAKSGAQTLTFKSVTDRHTNRQKLNVFGHPGVGWNPSLTKLGKVIEDPEHVLAHLKLLGIDAQFRR